MRDAIETERLSLQALGPGDVEVLHGLAVEEHVRRYLLDGAIVDRAWAAAEVERAAALWRARGVGMWLVRERGGAAPIGFAGFRVYEDIEPDPQLLYALRESATGRGYATELALALVDVARARGFEVVVSAVDEPNVASLRVLDKLGFERRGAVPGAFGSIVLVALAAARVPALRVQLLALARADERTRAELAARGALGGGYHPEMERVHARAAAELTAVLDEHGWPSSSAVGADGVRAAWLVVQHAIGCPALMRRARPLAWDAAHRGELPAAGAAMLDDRIRVLEGRPQRYGTQHDWNERGELAPEPIEDPAAVDDRRRTVGLPPLAEQIAALRAEQESKPPDLAAYRAEQHAWAVRSGWRS